VLMRRARLLWHGLGGGAIREADFTCADEFQMRSRR
jgi:hypothetical protein